VSYAVKEIFKTLQGEGGQAGRASVFCRFSGCNLWSGREEDRATAACRLCDTDFVGMDGTLGGRYGSAQALVDVLEKEWAGDRADRFVVLTGGEPLLQVDGGLVQALHDRGFEIALETNGTVELPAAVDWICVSPKTPEPLKIRSGNELKLVYPQADLRPEAFVDLDFRRFSLQPMDGADVVENTRQAIAYCLAHPKWQLSLQTHKYLGIR
jgi:7-carboxy-7-deazaguanine synthase (Cx14CxxC type)